MAQALRAACDVPLQVSGIDTFLALQSDAVFAPPGRASPSAGFTWRQAVVEGVPAWDIQAGPAGHALMRAARAYWAACAQEGLSQVIDHVVLSQAIADHLRDRLRPYDLVYVGVRCPVDVIDRRERERGDRTVGQGRGVGAKVHGFISYDVDIDTSTLSPRAGAREVLAAVRRRR